MEIRNLKVGDRFVKADGATCTLELLNDCRARIVVHGLSRDVVVDERFGTKQTKVYNQARNVSPGTEVLRVLDPGESQPKAEGRGDGSKEGRVMAKRTEETGRAKFTVLGVAATSAVCWMGKNEFSFGEAKAALDKLSEGGMPNDDSIRWCLTAGRTGRRPVPAMTAEQQKELRNAAKTVEAKTEKAEKKTTAATREKKGLPPIKARKMKKAGKKSASNGNGLKFSKAACVR